jgi:hypothetical protein
LLKMGSRKGEYLSASWENANLKRLPRPAVGGTRLGFERAFLAKKKRIYQ